MSAGLIVMLVILILSLGAFTYLLWFRPDVARDLGMPRKHVTRWPDSAWETLRELRESPIVLWPARIVALVFLILLLVILALVLLSEFNHYRARPLGAQPSTPSSCASPCSLSYANSVSSPLSANRQADRKADFYQVRKSSFRLATCVYDGDVIVPPVSCGATGSRARSAGRRRPLRA